jgi:hypothetical protein
MLSYVLDFKEFGRYLDGRIKIVHHDVFWELSYKHYLFNYLFYPFFKLILMFFINFKMLNC